MSIDIATLLFYTNISVSLWWRPSEYCRDTEFSVSWSNLAHIIIVIVYEHLSFIRPEVAYINRETVTLPALKQTVSNQNVERRKRTQILQKARMKREVIPWYTEFGAVVPGLMQTLLAAHWSVSNIFRLRYGKVHLHCHWISSEQIVETTSW